MRRHVGVRKWTKVVSLAVVAAITAASCGSDDESTSVTAAPAGPEATSGSDATTAPSADTAAPVADARELVIARDMDVNSLDISRSYCDTCQIFNTAVYETLITVDPADPNTIVARLATTWEANEDNTVFTFTLDPAATFADGSPVEAKDVKWSWERLANVKASASYLMSGLTSLEAPDAQTVVATFGAPNSAFLPIVAASYLGVINSDVATEQGAS
ncbi:MAG: ABC transporter substrate-binding protein, partial [Actinomycetota bacterium]|nr:ABC transporter substrate-binding protein [Actinomycetota bacterium]